MSESLIRLQGAHSEILLQTKPVTEIVYWGCKLAQSPESSLKSILRAVPNGRLDLDTPLSLSPEQGRGLFSSPGLEGHREGQNWSPVFHLQHIETNTNGVFLRLRDTIAQLDLTIEMQLDANTDVLQIRHTVTNRHATAYTLNRLAITLPLPAHADELLAFHGRWVHEFQPHRIHLPHGGYQHENRRGRTSHEYFPGLMQGAKGFSEQQGEVWGFHFGWSGNHRIRSDVKTDGRRFMQAEPLLYAGEIILQQDESFSTPWLYATYSETGLNGMSHSFQQFIRQQILSFPEVKARPVHLNTWEGIYFDHDPHYIMQMATEAAALGVERFIIDDGWFKGRHNDLAALGDWYLDQDKYPDGLEPVVEHVKQLGMEFGIWVEPEMVNPDSDLYRAHPDWLLAVDGYQQPTGRFQYVLDLQNPAVFEYLLERMDSLLSTYDISYVKWDMNREVVQPGHLGQAAQHKQVIEVYRLFDLLGERHPTVEFESCASGGGRIDFEVLKRTHRFWTSDNNDALERQQIQRGMSYFFPPEVMGAHIGGSTCHCTRRKHSISFRGLTALFGHMGVELDPVKESTEEKEGFTKYIALHKQLRPLLHHGRTYRIDHHDTSLNIVGVVSENQQEAIYICSQLAMPTCSLSGNVRFDGLLPDAQYKISILDQPASLKSGGLMKQLPPWMASETIVYGEWLMKAGLAMPVLDPESALLLKLDSL